MRPRLLSPLLCFAGFLIFSDALHAQFTWTGNSTAGSNITDAQNWTPSLPTGSGTENVTFDTSGTRINIVVPVSLAFNDVTFGTSRPLYTFSGTGSPALGINGNVSVGASSNAVTFNSSLSLTLDSGYHTIDVAGSATLLSVASSVTGTGGITKTGLGVISLSGANTYSGGTIIRAGSLNINTGSLSQGSGEMTVGDLSGDIGTLTIANGGDLTNNIGTLGLDAGSTGTANVMGNGSTWINNTTVNVGYDGTGILNISNDADVAGGATYVGTNAGSTGTITLDGSGSTLTATTLNVGNSGTGTLSITNGGVATATSLSYIADATGSNGAVTVDGAGSSLSYSNLFLARRGTGLLMLSNGGKVTVNAGAGTITLAQLSGSTGTLSIGGASAAPGGIVNAATITSGLGTGTVTFNTTATSSAPYYLTKDGTSGGAAVAITGSTSVFNDAGYNVLTGTGSTYTGNTILYGGTLADGNANAFSPNSVIGLLSGSSLVVNFNETIAGLSDYDGTGPVTIASGATLTINQSSSSSTYASIGGPGSLVKTGSGTLILGGTSAFTGGTTITGGTLNATNGNALGTGAVAVSGSGTLLVDEYFLSSAVQVNSGGRLVGNYGGYLTSTINAGGILSPGTALTGSSAIGALDFEDLTLGQNGIFEINVQFDGSGFNVDQAYVQNPATLTINATPANRFSLKVISLDSGYALGALGGLTPSTTYSWLIFDTNGIYDVTSAGSTITPASFLIDTSAFTTALGGGGLFTVSQTGNDIYLNFTPVPEPSTYALMAAGLVLAGLRYRRRQG